MKTRERVTVDDIAESFEFNRYEIVQKKHPKIGDKVSITANGRTRVYRIRSLSGKGEVNMDLKETLFSRFKTWLSKLTR